MVSIAHYVAVCGGARAADGVVHIYLCPSLIYNKSPPFFSPFPILVRASKILAPDPDDESGTTALDVRRACACALAPVLSTPHLVFNDYFN